MKPLLLFFLSLVFSFGLSAQQDARGIEVKKNNANSPRKNLALVVGISSYPHINRLLYADDDAYLFADYLVDQKICEKKDVIPLIDSAATKANFFKELRKLLDRSGDNDRVFIYFAGHGDVENDIESGFLLTYNCEPNNYPATDAIDISMLEKFVAAFTKKNVSVVLITDACRSGNLAGGMAGASMTLSSLSRGFQQVVKILSCQPNQLSMEKKYPEGGHGIFTYHLVDGLSGLADKDNDQFITLRELDRYLDEVAEETNQQQVPKMDGDPQTKISFYSQELKLALLARKENRSLLASNTKMRGLSDSSWLNNKYYKEFNDHVRANRLVSPEKNNAYFTIREAERTKQPAGLLSDLQLELAAILEDEAQKFINLYLRGALSYNQQEVLKQIQQVRSYLDAIGKMIGEKDIRYNEFLVKKLFFDGYYIFRKKDKQKYPEALAFLEKANRLIHNQAWISNAMGLLYEDLGKKDQAENSYLQAIRLAPQWSYPWNNLGLLYWNNQQLDKAEQAYKKSLELDSTYSYAWNGLGNVLDDAERYEEAIEAYKISIRTNPLDSDPWNGLGNVYFDLEKYKEAESAYRRAIGVDSAAWLAWNGLGIVLAEKENYEEAEAAYRQCLRIDSTYNHAWFNLGYVLAETGRYEEAEAAYRRCIGIDSAYSNAWNNLGILMENTHRLKEAPFYYRRSVEVDPRNAEGWLNLADALRQLNQPEEARLAYEKAFALATFGAIHYRMAASVCASLNKSEEAITWLKQALEKGYNNFESLERDQQLESIRALPRYKELIEKYRK